MSSKPSDETKPGTAKATLTPADLAQAVAEAHPEWLGQPLDARLLGQALREAFGVLRKQVDAVEVGTVAVPSLGRFHARRAPNKPDLRRVLFLTPQWAVPGTSELAVQDAEDTATPAPAAAPAPELVSEPEAVVEVAAAAPATKATRKAATKSSSKRQR